MLVFAIVLIIVAVALCALVILKKEWFTSLFGNSITSKVERKKKIEGEIEVLKKEQKVKTEETIKEFKVRKATEIDSITAQINSLKAQIKNLEAAKKDKTELLDQEQKVAIDKVINSYDRKITSKQNHAKKLSYYIDAEQKNIQDVIEPGQPNAPKERRVLLEETPKTKKK